MSPMPRHRPVRQFDQVRRVIVECEWERCVHCGHELVARQAWHMRKTVQTLNGPLFVAGKSKECRHRACAHFGMSYLASGVHQISLPYSTYGLDVLAHIGWQHDQQHQQLAEIHAALVQRGVQVSERHVGKLYRQYLALVGGFSEQRFSHLAAMAQAQGGLIWAVDGLQPEGHDTLLYVLWEVLSGTAVAATTMTHPPAAAVVAWLAPVQAVHAPVLATLSDGEDALVAALHQLWPEAPQQRCQCHFLNNLADPLIERDSALRQHVRQALGGLGQPPSQMEKPHPQPMPEADAPPFCQPPSAIAP